FCFLVSLSSFFSLYVLLFFFICFPPLFCAVIPFYCRLFFSVLPFSAMGRCPVLCAFVFFYVLLFHSMCRLSALCAIVSIYGPLIFSMCLDPVLCAFITFFRPSSRSMYHRSAMVRCPVLCAFVFFWSSCHRFNLWSVNFFYVPSSRSMCRCNIL